MAGVDARRTGQGGAAVAVEEIGRDPRERPLVEGQVIASGAYGVGDRLGGGDPDAEIAQRAGPALADDLLGHLRDHAEHPFDRPVVVGQR